MKTERERETDRQTDRQTGRKETDTIIRHCKCLHTTFIFIFRWRRFGLAAIWSNQPATSLPACCPVVIHVTSSWTAATLAPARAVSAGVDACTWRAMPSAAKAGKRADTSARSRAARPACLAMSNVGRSVCTEPAPALAGPLALPAWSPVPGDASTRNADHGAANPARPARSPAARSSVARTAVEACAAKRASASSARVRCSCLSP